MMSNSAGPKSTGSVAAFLLKQVKVPIYVGAAALIVTTLAVINLVVGLFADPIATIIALVVGATVSAFLGKLLRKKAKEAGAPASSYEPYSGPAVPLVEYLQVMPVWYMFSSAILALLLLSELFF